MSLAEHADHLATGHPGTPHAGGFLHKQYGPLSGGMWLVVISGGIVLGFVLKKHGPLAGGPAAGATPPADPSADPNAPAGGAPLDPTQGALGGPYAAGGPLPDTTTPTTPVGQPAASTTPAPAVVVTVLEPPDAPAGVLPPPAGSGPRPTPTAALPAAHHTPAHRPAPAPHQPTRPRTPAAAGAYTVVGGDTLSSIASRHKVSVGRLVELNRATLDATARAHGRPDSAGGHWIYPGELLRLA